MIVGRVIATLAAPHGPSTIGGAMDETPGRHEAGHQGAMDVVPSPMASSHQLGVSPGVFNHLSTSVPLHAAPQEWHAGVLRDLFQRIMPQKECEANGP